MTTFFGFEDKIIKIKNNGESYGYLEDTCYSIGEKLFEFIKFDNEDIDILRKLYDELIKVIAKCKFENLTNALYDEICKIVYKCLEFSPYTHFYNQLLIDTLIKTYNMNFIRSDIVIKNRIDLRFDENFNDEEYEMHDVLLETKEDTINTFFMIQSCLQKTKKFSEQRNKEFLLFFEKVKEALILDFFKRQDEAKRRIIMMGEYSNQKAIRDLTPEQKMYLYELKGVYDLSDYINLIETNTIFLDTSFKIKYIIKEKLKNEDSQLNIIELANKIQQENIEVQEVYELDSAEEQIRFELFKIIQNNIIIKKCANCGQLFIPDKTDQLYCTNLYNGTEKTCKELGALIKRKEKIKNSKILKEYNREYKRMYGIHYNHSKEFREKKFKEWSKKARELRKKYTDDEIEEFKIQLKNLSDLYWKN